MTAPHAVPAPRFARLTRLLPALCLCLAVGCGDPKEPVALQLLPGGSFAISKLASPGPWVNSYVVYADGSADPVAADWASSAPSVLSVEACGTSACLATHDVTGVTTISASYRGFSTFVRVSTQ
jgi:hypothetical protein